MNERTSSKRGRETELGFSTDGVPAYEKPRDAQRVRADNTTSGGASSKRWTPEQDDALRQAVSELGQRNWMAVAERVPGRDNAQCLQRWNKVLKPGLVKGPWSVDEDNLLMETMLKGYDSWREVAAQIPGRTAKQCRERWRNRLDPNINKAPFTEAEDVIIQQAYEKLGNRWTQIAELLPGRTEDSVKLRWKTLNPNQRTYTKLGRPRLLPTDQIDHPELAFSPGPTAYGLASASLNATVVPTPPSSTESSTSSSSNQTQQVLYDPQTQSQTQTQAHLAVEPVAFSTKAVDASLPGTLPEPIVGGDDSDEEMSSEDIVIFKAFLRGQSSGSLRLDGSFRNLLSLTDIPEDVAKSYPGLASLSGSSSRSLQRGSSISWAPIEATAATASGSGDAKPRRTLTTMMSLGSVRSASLRSLTEETVPFFGDDLNRQLSGMSLIEGFGGDDEDPQQQNDSNQESHASGSQRKYMTPMDSFENAQLIAETMLQPVVDLTKSPTFTEQLSGVNTQGATSSGRTPSQQISEELLQEFITFPEPVSSSNNNSVDASASAPAPAAGVVSVQDFYNGDVALDLLASADRFEI